MASFSNDNEKYNSVFEHSAQDIMEVKKLADEEQARRMNDEAGESIRRMNAHTTSEIFSESVRTNWFSQGSAFMFNLLHAARSRASSIASDTATGVKSRLSGVSSKSKEVANDIMAKTQDTQAKGAEKANEVQQIIKVKIESAQSNIQEVAQQSLKKIQGAALSFTSSSRNLWGKLNQSFTKKTNLAFLLLEEETERAYRMNSTESHAILNGLAVSTLIKDLGWEFYRPTSEPSRAWSTRTLEKMEQSRRMLSDISSKQSSENAKKVAALLEHKWKGTTPAPAALVAAKAEVMSEIKSHNMMSTAAM